MNPNGSSRRLADLAEGYYRRAWERFPTFGSIVGLEEYDSRLEAPDTALIEEQLRDARSTLAQFEALPALEKDAPVGESLDRREFESQLMTRILQLETIHAWSRDPAEPIDELVTSVFFLVMRRDVTKPATAEAVAARLEAAPAFLKAVRSRITDPISLWVDMAGEIADGGKAFVKEIAAGVGEKHPLLKDRLTRGAGLAAGALEEYAAWLRELKTRKLSQDPSIGAPALTAFVRMSHGLSESLEEISNYGRSQIEFFRKRQAEVAKEIDPRLTPRQILEAESRRYAEREPDLLAEYRRITFEIRERLVSQGVLEMPPGESCDVISTPGFLRPMLPTAAYSSPGPLDRNQRGIFYVSDPPKSLSREDYLANVAQHFPLDPTCAHEAYPGHHVQLCWANQAPSLIRKLSDHIIFMEGWTLYCEQMMVELGWYPSRAFELGYLNDQLWRACRIVIDVGVQSGRMTIPQAIEMLQKEVGFTPLRAKTELNWYTQKPGTPMSYLLGKGKTLALREKYRAAHPGSSLKDFHGWLLRHGSVPQTWLLEAGV